MNTANLFARWASNDKAMTARVLITLQQHWGVRHMGDIGEDAIVELPFCNPFREDGKKWNNYEWFTLCNNGGEINVEPINHDERMRSIPYTSDFFTLTAETIAWRIWCAMTGQAIDWQDNDIPAAHVDAEPLKIIECWRG